jgi:hypothetical protein
VPDEDVDDAESAAHGEMELKEPRAHGARKKHVLMQQRNTTVINMPSNITRTMTKSEPIHSPACGSQSSTAPATVCRP